MADYRSEGQSVSWSKSSESCMEIIENVLGRGLLFRRNESVCEVAYDLIVFRRGSETGVAGRISGSIECLVKVHYAHKLTLRMVDGRQLKIIIKRVDFRAETADFEGTGWFF